jgi:hypothetical protein
MSSPYLWMRILSEPLVQGIRRFYSLCLNQYYFFWKDSFLTSCLLSFNIAKSNYYFGFFYHLYFVFVLSTGICVWSFAYLFVDELLFRVLLFFLFLMFATALLGVVHELCIMMEWVLAGCRFWRGTRCCRLGTLTLYTRPSSRLLNFYIFAIITMILITIIMYTYHTYIRIHSHTYTTY